MPVEEFYAHPQMADGRLNRCKSCVKARVRKHRANNLEKIQEYDRIRGRSEERIAYQKEMYHKHKGRRPNYAKSWQARNPEKRKAHGIVNNAIRDGKLLKGVCEVCGSEKVDAHHDDYSKPLEVRWLCRKHHAETWRRYA